MIQQLLFPFKTYPSVFCKLSETGIKNLNSITNLRYYYANKALMYFTLGWLGFVFFKSFSIYNRPVESFAHPNAIEYLLMPVFPSYYLFCFVGFSTLILVLSLLFYKDSILKRIILVFCILWLSTVQWSFGCHSAVGNLFLLSHIFGIFIPYSNIIENHSNTEIRKSIEWCYLGLLITYTYSGFWKWAGLIYKLLLKPEEISWLSPVAALNNATLGHLITDRSFGHIVKYFSFPLFWQICFLITSFFLFFSFLGAYRQALRLWVGLFLIIFHTVNSVFFNTHFYIAPLVVVCLFFPYEILIAKINSSGKAISESILTGSRLNYIYYRYYKNGDKDVFIGFYALREYVYDKKYIVGGLLYTPMLDVIIIGIWWLESIVKLKIKSMVHELKQ